VTISDSLPAALALGATYCTGSGCNPIGGPAWTGSLNVARWRRPARSCADPRDGCGIDGGWRCDFEYRDDVW